MEVKEHPSRWRIFLSQEFALSFPCHLFITAPLCSWTPICSFPFLLVFLPYSTSLSTYILPEKAGEITLPLPLSYYPVHLSASPQPSVWLIVAPATGQELPAALCFDRGCMPSCSDCHTQNGLFTTAGTRLVAWETSFRTVSYCGLFFFFSLQFVGIPAHPSKIQFVAQLSTLVRGGSLISGLCGQKMCWKLDTVFAPDFVFLEEKATSFGRSCTYTEGPGK